MEKGTKAANAKRTKGKMPSVRKPIAIAVADLHLSMKAPACRMEEPDWFEAMARPLRKLGKVAETQNVPILCAGDVFDKWKSFPELINFAITHMPQMCAIPGQHDMPNHLMDHMQKSAFITLCAANTIYNMRTLDNSTYSQYALHVEDAQWPEMFFRGVPWGSEIPAAEPTPHSRPHVAVIHKYIWQKKEHKHMMATMGSHVSNLEKSLQGYDFAIFGDNHIPFTTMVGDCRVVNCGTFMHRKKGDHEPRAWILYDDKTVKEVFLASDDDVITEAEDAVVDLNKADRFDRMLKDLEGLGEDATSFADAFKRVLDSYSATIRAAAYEMMEED